METPTAGRAILLALGLTACGWFIGQGFVQSRTADRYVTVKGVAERVVSADVGLWPMRFVATDEDLAVAQSRVERQRRTIAGFLAGHGIDSASVEVQGIEVVDTRANPYGEARSGSRFVVTMSLIVRTDDPAKLQLASQRVGELVQAGVVLQPGNFGSSGPTFLFTRLNDLKPDMIAQATASARQAAEQFARDAKSALGGIRRASQGVFEILPRDQAPGIQEGSQVQKTLRVVTTVEYRLR